MRASPIYFGLDIATTMGVAAWNPGSAMAYVATTKGTPLNQIEFIRKYAFPSHHVDKKDYIFVIESLHHFRNKTTVRSLLERAGYLKWCIKYEGFEVKEAAPDVVRKHLGVKEKTEMFIKLLPHYNGSHFTSDHADALAVAMYQGEIDGFPVDWRRLDIVDIEGVSS